MSNRLTSKQFSDLCPALGSLARLVARYPVIHESQIRLLLTAVSQEGDVTAREEMERWARLLCAARDASDAQEREAAVEALQLCGHSEAAVLLAVDTATRTAGVADNRIGEGRLPDSQVLGNEALVVRPAQLDFGLLAAGTIASAILEVTGPAFAVRTSTDFVRVAVVESQPEGSRLAVEVRPVGEGVLMSVIELASGDAVTTIPVVAQWEELLADGPLDVRHGGVVSESPSIDSLEPLNRLRVDITDRAEATTSSNAMESAADPFNELSRLQKLVASWLREQDPPSEVHNLEQEVQNFHREPEFPTNQVSIRPSPVATVDAVGEIECAAFTARFSHNGRVLFVAGRDGSLRQLEIHPGLHFSDQKWNATAVRAIAVDLDGRHVWLGGEDRQISRWDLHCRQRIFRTPVLDELVGSLIASPVGHWLISDGGAAADPEGLARDSRMLRVWKVGAGGLAHQGNLHWKHSGVTCEVAAFTSQRTGIVAACVSAKPRTERSLRFWPGNVIGQCPEGISIDQSLLIPTPEIKTRIQALTTAGPLFAFSQDDRFVIGNFSIPGYIQVFPGGCGKICSLIFSCDTRWLVVSNNIGQICLFRVSTGEFCWSTQIPSPATELVCSPCGGLFASINAENIGIWRLPRPVRGYR